MSEVLNLPVRFLILGSGEGNIHWLYRYIQLLQDIGSFDDVYIVSNNINNEPIYMQLETTRPEFQHIQSINDLRDLDSMDATKRQLIVFDSIEFNCPIMLDFVVKARSSNYSIFFLNESFCEEFVRDNIINVALFGQLSSGVLSAISRIVNVYEERFTKMHQFATREQFTPLVIDLFSDEKNKISSWL